MYTKDSYRNYMIISPFLRLLLHFKHLRWSNVRWKFVLLSLIDVYLIQFKIMVSHTCTRPHNFLKPGVKKNMICRCLFLLQNVPDIMYHDSVLWTKSLQGFSKTNVWILIIRNFAQCWYKIRGMVGIIPPHPVFILKIFFVVLSLVWYSRFPFISN